MLIIFLLSACGRSRDRDGEDEEINGTVNGGVFVTHTNQTLRVSAHAMYEVFLKQAAAELGIDIEVYDYRFGEEAAHYDTMLSRLAAGEGPDVFIWGMVNPSFHRFAEEGFLSDLYAVINPPDLFMNAVTPFETEGQLLMMPTRFNFEFVGINENIPADIAQRFASQTAITPSFLMDLHSDLLSLYPQWGEYAFMLGKDAYSFVRQEMHKHVDIANASVDLTGLEQMLDSLRVAFNDNNRFKTAYINPSNDYEMRTVQERYIFHTVVNTHHALFDYTHPVFIHYLPLADESGRLAQRSASGANISVTNRADIALAWAFLREFIAREANQPFRMPDAPIVREYFTSAVDAGLNALLTRNEVRPIAGERDAVIYDAVARLYALSQLPMTHPADFFLPVLGRRIVDDFLTGDMASDEAVRLIEHEILVWMGAEREIATPEEEPEDNAHLPPMTLTFQGSNRHAAVAQQAAEAMNLAWRRRGEPYRFELVTVNTFNELSGDADNRYTLLATQLMAGTGPDIFVVEREYNVHALARSGFLVDLYTLMDHSSHAKREDFFTQALTAFEMYNGLYMLPLNFSYNYVKINVNLPQSILDMYTHPETITLTQMMEIYITLITDYADEYGHMLFGQSDALVSIFEVLQHIMGEYIDFDVRSSDLLNPGFIAFLDAYSDINNKQQRDQRSLFILEVVGGTLPHQQRARGWDNSLVFYMGSGVTGGNQADNFFTHSNPVFSHTRLLTDSGGRLSLGIPNGTFATGPTWPAISVTAAGDHELAWEFIQYLIDAFTTPEGRARGEWGILFGYNQLGSPIRRDLYEYHTMRAMDRFLGVTQDRPPYNDYVGLTDPAERELQVRAALSRIAAYNEMPMVTLHPMVPRSLIMDDIRLFMNGIISSQDLAQRLNNIISLWLIE
jgi:ABC-type glycerol-3-phosphate transport system substrate-binding protein